MIGKHDILIDVANDTVVWRYIDQDKYLSLLQNQALFFCRADRFIDPFEGSIPKKQFEYREIEHKENDKFFKREHDPELMKRNIEGTQGHHKKDKEFTVVNCWHINNNENDGMWNLYLKDNTGVAIKTTVGRIKEALSSAKEEIFISKVRYLNYESDYWYHKTDYPHNKYNFLIPLIHKRIEFVGEQELRLFHPLPYNIRNDDPTYWTKQTNGKGMLIPVDVVTLVESVHFAPTADDRTKAAIQEETLKLKFDFQFYNSKLQSEPYY